MVISTVTKEVNLLSHLSVKRASLDSDQGINLSESFPLFIIIFLVLMTLLSSSSSSSLKRSGLF